MARIIMTQLVSEFLIVNRESNVLSVVCC